MEKAIANGDENGNGGEKRKPIGALSFDTQQLYERLLKNEGNFASVIPYAEFSAIIGRDVQGDARGCLTSARRMALREKRLYFGTMAREGVKLLTDVERVAQTEAIIKHIGRSSRKGIRTAASVTDYEAMPQDMKTKHQTAITIFKLAEHVVKPRQQEVIEAAVKEQQKFLPVNSEAVVELFKKKK